MYFHAMELTEQLSIRDTIIGWDNEYGLHSRAVLYIEFKRFRNYESSSIAHSLRLQP